MLHVVSTISSAIFIIIDIFRFRVWVSGFRISNPKKFRVSGIPESDPKSIGSGAGIHFRVFFGFGSGSGMDKNFGFGYGFGHTRPDPTRLPSLTANSTL